MASMKDELIMVDEQSVVDGVDRVITSFVETEREKVFSMLPDVCVERFGQLGFYRNRPVQVVSPYDIPPGSLRRQWIDQFSQLKQKGELKNLPILVCWLDASGKSVEDRVTLERSDDFDKIEKADEVAMPRPLSNKYILRQELSDEDDRLLDALGDMKEAVQKPVAERGLPFTPTPDYKFFKIVPSDPDNNREMPSLNSRVSIYWAGDAKWYSGYVAKIKRGFYYIHYDDNTAEWLPLEDCQFKILRTGAAACPPKALKDRCTADGCIRPKSEPLLLQNGTYKKPNGRPPDGYVWSEKNGVWEPAPTDYKRKSHGLSEISDRPSKIVKADEVGFLEGQMDEEVSSCDDDDDSSYKERGAKNKTSKPKHSKSIIPRNIVVPNGPVQSFPPKTPIQRNSDGFFPLPPGGRRPKNCTWNKKTGRWDRLVTHEGHHDGNPSEQSKRLKETPKSIREVKVDCVKKDSPVATTRHVIVPNIDSIGKIGTISNAMVVASSSVESDESNKKRSEMLTNIAGKLMGDLLKELPPESDDAVDRCSELLDRLSELDIPVSKVEKGIFVPIYKLQTHPTLGHISSTLIKKWRKAHAVNLINDWKRAVDTGNAETAVAKVRELYNLVHSDQNPLVLSDDFIVEHELEKCVKETENLFENKRVSCDELQDLYDMVDLDDTAGASGVV